MTNTTPKELLESFKYLFPTELDFLVELTLMLPSNPRIVNIGAGAGTSTSAFLHTRKDSIVYSIDLQFAASPFGSLEGETVALKEMGLHDVARYIPITGMSHNIARQWTWDNVDMVFIDDGHLYDECRGDIELWLPHLKDGGIIAVHDFDKWEHAQRMFPTLTEEEAKPWPGVDKAVRYTLLGKYEFIRLVGTTIAFYKKPSDIYPSEVSQRAIGDDELGISWRSNGN